MRLSLLVLLVGCTHRGMRFPGPLGSMGQEPPPYADTLDSAPADAAVAPDAEPARSRRKSRGDGADVARAAGGLVGKGKLVVSGERYRYDCSGMVEASYARTDIPLRGSSRSMHELARKEGLLHKKKRPALGDVAFFDNTYDRNKNGRRDDKLTHVAIVESVDEHDTATLIHLGSKGVVRISMNVRHPHDRRADDGRELNSHLRAGGKKGGETLAGELWVGFGSLWALDDGALSDLGCVRLDPAG